MATKSDSFYVYGWFNLDWGVYFYIGKGIGDRYEDTKNRSNWFKSIIDNWNCEPVILEDNLTEENALKLESLLKEDFIFEKGYPIIDLENGTAIKMAQRRGIEKAKDEGKHLGRPPMSLSTLDEDVKSGILKLYPIWKSGGITATKFMEAIGLKRNTFYKIIKEYEQVV